MKAKVKFDTCMWVSLSEQTSDNTLQNKEGKANLLKQVQTLLPRQTAGMEGTQCVAEKVAPQHL